MIDLGRLLAQLDRGDVELPNVPNRSGGGGIAGLDSILNAAALAAGSIAVMAVVWGGFKYIMSRGNPQETAKAQQTIIYGLIGLAVVVIARFVVAFVVERFG